MSALRKALARKIPLFRDRVINLKKQHGSKTLHHVKIQHLLSGLHSLPVLFHATSKLDPDYGPFLRGVPIREIEHTLLKTESSSAMPSIETVFWFLLTGETPKPEEVLDLKRELFVRGRPSNELKAFMASLPKGLTPMAQYSMALLFLSKNSVFREKIAGCPKDSVWELVLEDGLELLAKSSSILVNIANNRNGKALKQNENPEKDWCARLAKSFDMPKEFKAYDFMRLFALLHVDHEGGNVSTHTTMAASSAYADPFSSYSSGVNGLSGSLHGYVNRDVMIFLMKLREELKGDLKTEKILEFANQWKKQKGTIPGFGHAILRKKDLRYCLFEEWGLKHCPHSELLKLNKACAEAVSSQLKEQGKVKNPNPNIDFNSGSLLYHYGVKDIELYPVFFATARAFGCVANMILERGLGLPIEYPLSMDIESLERL